jgi:pectin methylesterase-like acyl-CoA thioesterase
MEDAMSTDDISTETALTISKQIAMALAVGLALVGCASTPENLQRASATSLGMPGRYVISDVQRDPMSVSWTATAQGGETYACSADDMVRRTSCSPRREVTVRHMPPASSP